jgi:DNA excision repair protein ERCC-3
MSLSDGVSHLFNEGDYGRLKLKPDHKNCPLWINLRRKILMLERFSPMAEQATDFLITIAEPRSRPTHIHEYKITDHSLYAAVAAGLQTGDILRTLDRFLKTELPYGVRKYIESRTKSYGKVKMVLKRNKYFVESADLDVLQILLKDKIMAKAWKRNAGQHEKKILSSKAAAAPGLAISGTADAAGLKQAGFDGSRPQGVSQGDRILANLQEDEDDDEDVELVHSIQIREGHVEQVQKRCLELGYPILEEYDFRYDDINPDLDIDLRPNTQIRTYQEKSLSKMFGNGRAKSGIIVLPCGAGKTLVGITAACTIKKGTVVVCTSNVSAAQWRAEFLKWTNIQDSDIALFTSDTKEVFCGSTGIIVTTYGMLANERERSKDSKKVMEFLKSREWGFMIIDEVHAAPAKTFRLVVSMIKAHSKLGLTATLLREDDKIEDLNFLIGPKLFEANWMELSQLGHIAKVQCAQVWCTMPRDFLQEYRQTKNDEVRTALSGVNPAKFQACQYLIKYHEARGDKIIIFSDNLYTLKLFAVKMQRAYIYGGTDQEERMNVLENFRHNPLINTIFLSGIGDTSLDLPEATCLIQLTFHYGSRRQEAQRLGRILRAKRRNDEGFNAFFYTLVSKDTREMQFSVQRQSFLVDQGYAFKTITKLNGLEDMPGLDFNTEEERARLLRATVKDHSPRTDDKGNDAGRNTRDKPHRNAPQKPKGGTTKQDKQVKAHEREGLAEVLEMPTTDTAPKPTDKKAGATGKKKEQNPFFKQIARQNKQRAAKAAEEPPPRPPPPPEQSGTTEQKRRDDEDHETPGSKRKKKQ